MSIEVDFSNTAKRQSPDAPKHAISVQQQDVIDWVINGTGSLNLVARAGCGKTTTLIHVVETIVSHKLGNVFLGAYNKAIADEIQVKLVERGITNKFQACAGTMHSLGFGLWRNSVKGKVKVDDQKLMNIINPLGESDLFTKRFAALIRQSVSIAKQTGFGLLHSIDDHAAWYEMLEHFGIDDEIYDPTVTKQLVQVSIDVLKLSIAQNEMVIDFDDMLLAPLIGNVRVRYPYDWVLIDEAQDTNATRRALALKVLKPATGRLIAVGDDRQAIYGFTGADAEAMSLIKQQLGSTELPLNVTYRCPQTVVAEAQHYVPDITAHETAPEGNVYSKQLVDKYGSEGEEERGITRAEFRNTDVILCRNTAPVIQLAYDFISRKIPCRVEGRDIGKGLMKLAQRWKVRKLADLHNKLDDHLERERAKWLSKGREMKAAALEDRITALKILIDLCLSEGKHNLEDLWTLISSMFDDAKPGVKQSMLTLSTIHKAKGREWDRVFILNRDKYMPSRYARKAWQKLQEDNLAYVAITRAKQELVYLTVEEKQK